MHIKLEAKRLKKDCIEDSLMNGHLLQTSAIGSDQ